MVRMPIARAAKAVAATFVIISIFFAAPAMIAAQTPAAGHAQHHPGTPAAGATANDPCVATASTPTSGMPQAGMMTGTPPMGAGDMIHDPATAHELDAWNLKGNGLAMTAEGQAMAAHGRAMTAQVQQLQEAGALSPDLADQLVAAGEEMIATGEELERDGQRMQETAEVMLALIGQ